MVSADVVKINQFAENVFHTFVFSTFLAVTTRPDIKKTVFISCRKSSHICNQEAN